MRIPTMAETAREHRAADAACGREWVCACAACRNVRKASRAAAALGAIGGAAGTGHSKRRDVDYAKLGHLGGLKRGTLPLGRPPVGTGKKGRRK